MIPKIKICGITEEKEADFLNESKADYAGFVFYEKSKRNVSLEKALDIIALLDKDIKTVAVTVDPFMDDIDELMNAGFDVIQVHGLLDDAVTEFTEGYGTDIWRAVNIKSGDCLDELKDISKRIDGIVIDGENFGSGQTFDWENTLIKREYIGERKLILAGGLNASNVSRGIEIFHPDIVDVSSGAETDGKKDRKKITEFVKAVRSKGTED